MLQPFAKGKSNWKYTEHTSKRNLIYEWIFPNETRRLRLKIKTNKVSNMEFFKIIVNINPLEKNYWSLIVRPYEGNQ